MASRLAIFTSFLFLLMGAQICAVTITDNLVTRDSDIPCISHCIESFSSASCRENSNPCLCSRFASSTQQPEFESCIGSCELVEFVTLGGICGTSHDILKRRGIASITERAADDDNDSEADNNGGDGGDDNTSKVSDVQLKQSSTPTTNSQPTKSSDAIWSMGHSRWAWVIATLFTVVILG